MRAIELLHSCGVSGYFARMEDQTFRWVSFSMCLLSSGPHPAWVARGLTAHSVSWNGPNIQRPLAHDMLLATLNRNIQDMVHATS